MNQGETGKDGKITNDNSLRPGDEYNSRPGDQYKARPGDEYKARPGDEYSGVAGDYSGDAIDEQYPDNVHISVKDQIKAINQEKQ